MSENKGQNTIDNIVTIRMPTECGVFDLSAFMFRNQTDPTLALTIGELRGRENVPVRLHSSCLTGDVFGSERCDCGPQLHFAMQFIATEQLGMVIYLHQEGRGIGLFKKLEAYKLQERGLDTVDANLALGLPIDCREYSGAAAIIRHFGIKNVRLLTNNPDKRKCLEEHGIQVRETVSVIVEPNPNNAAYLTTKRLRMGHLLPPFNGH